MKTEIINNIANEAVYQLKYYKKLYLAYKKNTKILLKISSKIIICLIAFHVYYY